MTPEEILTKEAQPILEHLSDELTTIRTGRAHPNLVLHLLVDAYGARSPLETLASVTVPESRTLVIAPWDRSIIKDIEKAIIQSPLGLSPVNEGALLRIVLPELTEERRQELVKVINTHAEKSRIGLRAVREKMMKDIKRQEKDGAVGKDESARLQKIYQETFEHLQQDIERRREEKKKNF